MNMRTDYEVSVVVVVSSEAGVGGSCVVVVAYRLVPFQFLPEDDS